ncbi:MAG: hypothetical protein P8Q26_00865 [Ascidiaceihabitans sp.]|nr:hypothetical protein [Ascidiaceihabitans sp.]
MTTTNHFAIAFALATASGTALSAQEASRFTFEIETEIGVDSVISSDDPTAEISDTFLTSEATLGFQITDTVSAFAGLTLESVLDATNDRAFEDVGLYIDSIGLSFDLGNSVVSVGKFAPAFGVAWDAAPGFYGTNFVEDYELSEALGASASFQLGAGVLTASLFYLDDSFLSRSLGTDRGRNTSSAGGVGNTGKLDNLALQYELEEGATTYSISASHLSASVGDVQDQNGLAFGIVHAARDDLELIAEIAAFDGFGGADDRATYSTIGAAYTLNNWTLGASYTNRDVRSSGSDHLASLGADYTFANDITVSSGLGYAEESGVDSTLLGVSVIIPIGG